MRVYVDGVDPKREENTGAAKRSNGELMGQLCEQFFFLNK